ncbi:MAG TPA: LAGLIDADG family homing endonuclease [Candidatus Paceibacterota bacterium]|nr:LAGLIDADG family homing endonuclease [Candidatus Paceibacterota bacterium]
MASVKSLRYPKKSHRKHVVLPKHSAEFAEFFGIMIGDGGVNNPWQAKITVNAVADRGYSEYIVKLCRRLFGIKPSSHKRSDTKALDIHLNSVTIVDFLISEGLRRGNKLAQGLDIPNWILAKPLFRAACIRGLVDTDGCLYVHNHIVAGRRYRNLGLCFSSRSPLLLNQVARAFEESGLLPHIDRRGQNVYLYRADSVIRYLKIFGSSNDRIHAVYKKWKGARAV